MVLSTNEDTKSPPLQKFNPHPYVYFYCCPRYNSVGRCPALVAHAVQVKSRKKNNTIGSVSRRWCQSTHGSSVGVDTLFICNWIDTGAHSLDQFIYSGARVVIIETALGEHFVDGTLHNTGQRHLVQEIHRCGCHGIPPVTLV